MNSEIIKIYKVGGYVRDHLLDLESKDIDYVVVGATPEDLLLEGYQQVGADFPVFLHPESGDEYALARTERSTGNSYNDFETCFDPTVSLEEDLMRRDLTINAMAMDDHGNIYDPYMGLRDLNERVLRHVGEAFKEDPLRILRVARFKARYHKLGFDVADETMALMRDMAANGMLKSMTAERIWKETSRALMEDDCDQFFRVLKEANALSDWFPEINALINIPQVAQHHPEICTFEHTMLCLREAVKMNAELGVRYAVLCHDLGKGETPEGEWPRHFQHERNGVPLVKHLSERLKVPKEMRLLAQTTSNLHLKAHVSPRSRPGTLEEIFSDGDFYRHPERFTKFLMACECDSKGRIGFENRPYPQRDYLQGLFDKARNVSAKDIVEKKGIKGPEVGEHLRIARINEISPHTKSIRKEVKRLAKEGKEFW